jgi:hypothetical protein
MTLAVWFWLIYVISLIFGFWGEYHPGQPYPFIRGAWFVVLYILLGIIGLKLFGSPVQ